MGLGRQPCRRSAAWLSAAIGLFAAGPALAGVEDDLSTRVAAIEALAAQHRPHAATLTISGWINEAVMWFDDGAFNRTYVGGNNNSTSRVVFKGGADITSDLSAGYIIELGMRFNNSNTFNQNSPSNQNTVTDLIRSAWTLKSHALGLLIVGRYAQVNDVTANLRIENTGMSSTFADDLTNGGFFLRNTARPAGPAQQSALRFLDLIPTSSDSIVGQVRRSNKDYVVRYETPEVLGFTAMGSFGENDAWAVALRYGGDVGDLSLVGGISYSGISGLNFGNDGCANLGTVVGPPGDVPQSAVNCTAFATSGGALHKPSGLFVSATYGLNHDYNRGALFHALTGVQASDVTSVDWSWGMSFGLEKNYFGPGRTTLYGEMVDSHGGAGLSSLNGSCLGTLSPGKATPKAGEACALAKGDALNPFASYAFVASAEVREWGAGVVQEVSSAATDLYIAYKHFDLEVSVSTTGGRTGAIPMSAHDFQTLMAGARISF